MTKGKKRGKLRIIDCTLRDGEQTPGVVFKFDEKLQLAEALSHAGVHTLDAAFPAVSENECKILSSIKEFGFNIKVGATVRALREEVDLAITYDTETVFIFYPVSDIHIRYKMDVSKDIVEQRVKDICHYSSQAGLETFFVAEDSARQDFRWVAHLCDIAAKAGADGAILCDTVGILTPDGIKKHVSGVIEHMETSIPLGIHCHNDFGMATANTVSAVIAGVDIVTCTVAGIGERAGNAPLEEVVVSLEELSGFETGIDLSVLPALTDMVEKMSGIFLSPNKPIVGRNVFSHESGIHVKGMMKNPLCYEALSPERVGRKSRFILGKHSGGSLVNDMLKNCGINLSETEVSKITRVVKDFMEQKPKENFDNVRQVLDKHYSHMTGISEIEFLKIVEEYLPDGLQNVNRS